MKDETYDFLIKHHDEYSCSHMITALSSYIAKIEDVLVVCNSKKQLDLFERGGASRDEAITFNRIKLLRAMKLCKIVHQKIQHLYATGGDPEK